MPASVTTARPASRELVRFLLARVDEDDAELKRLARQRTEPFPAGVLSLARLQSDVAAKRRLIGALQQLLVLRDQPFEKAIRDQALQMLRVLATPYGGHAAYRPEWRPSGAH
jgi:hypothetical protein